MKATPPRTPPRCSAPANDDLLARRLHPVSHRRARRRPKQMGVDDIDSSGAGARAGEQGEQPVESHIRDEEVFRMAAFRIRETANRILTLANSTRSENTAPRAARGLRAVARRGSRAADAQSLTRRVLPVGSGRRRRQRISTASCNKPRTLAPLASRPRFQIRRTQARADQRAYVGELHRCCRRTRRRREAPASPVAGLLDLRRRDLRGNELRQTPRSLARPCWMAWLRHTRPATAPASPPASAPDPTASAARS